MAVVGGSGPGQLEGRDRVGAHLAVAQDRLGGEPAQEAQVGPHAEDRRPVERILESGQRIRAARAVDDELGEHRVVAVRHGVALLDAGVDAGAVRPAEQGHRPGGGEEPGLGVLGVETGLDGVPFQ